MKLDKTDADWLDWRQRQDHAEVRRVYGLLAGSAACSLLTVVLGVHMAVHNGSFAELALAVACAMVAVWLLLFTVVG